MKIDKPDALMLHSVLFAYVNSNVNLDFVDVEHLQSLQERLQDFITDSQEDCQEASDTEEDYDESDDDNDDYDDEESEEEEEEEEEDPIDVFVAAKDAADLSPLSVVSPDGSTVSLEFEYVGEDDMVDALIDEGTVIVDSVVKVVVDEKSVSLYDGEEWHDFKVVKLSKYWKRFFPSGQVVGFSTGEKE